MYLALEHGMLERFVWSNIEVCKLSILTPYLELSSSCWLVLIKAVLGIISMG